MTLDDKHAAIAAAMEARLGERVQRLENAADELTYAVAPGDLLDCCRFLRDTEGLQFEMLMDLCGVDYLSYGCAEWDTASATATGFSRGVLDRGDAPGGGPASDGWVSRGSMSGGPASGGSGAGGLDVGGSVVGGAARGDPGVGGQGVGGQGVGGSGTGRSATSGVGEPLAETGYQPPSRFAVVYHLLSISNNARLRLKVACEDNERPMVDSVTGVWASADWFEREAFDLFGILFVGHPDLRRILTDYGFIGHPFRKDFPLIGKAEVRYDPKKGRVVYEPVSIEPRTLVPKAIRDDNRYQPDLGKD